MPTFEQVRTALGRRLGPHVAATATGGSTTTLTTTDTRLLASTGVSDSFYEDYWLHPTSGNEDFVSMSMGAALKAGQMADNVRTILAVEILCGCQGLDLLAPLKTSPSLERAKQALRSWVPMLKADRELTPDIEATRRLVASGAFQAILSD